MYWDCVMLQVERIEYLYLMQNNKIYMHIWLFYTLATAALHTILIYSLGQQYIHFETELQLYPMPIWVIPKGI